jgi:alcohol dehydrogenase
MLLKTIGVRKLEPGLLITHHFKFAQIFDAHRTFDKAAENQALRLSRYLSQQTSFSLKRQK